MTARVLNANGTIIEKFERRGDIVYARRNARGKHHEFCLCYACDRYDPTDRENNYPIANRLNELCAEENIVTPVFECPAYTPIIPF